MRMAAYFVVFCIGNSLVVVCLVVVAFESDAEGWAQLGGCCRGWDVLAE